LSNFLTVDWHGCEIVWLVGGYLIVVLMLALAAHGYGRRR